MAPMKKPDRKYKLKVKVENLEGTKGIEPQGGWNRAVFGVKFQCKKCGMVTRTHELSGKMASQDGGLLGVPCHVSFFCNMTDLHADGLVATCVVRIREVKQVILNKPHTSKTILKIYTWGDFDMVTRPLLACQWTAITSDAIGNEHLFDVHGGAYDGIAADGDVVKVTGLRAACFLVGVRPEIGHPNS